MTPALHNPDPFVCDDAAHTPATEAELADEARALADDEARATWEQAKAALDAAGGAA